MDIINVKEITKIGTSMDDSEDELYMVRAEIGEEEIFGEITQLYTMEKIKSVCPHDWKFNDIKLEIACSVLIGDDFKRLRNLPPLSETPKLLQKIYKELKETDSGMLFIEEDNWEEDYEEFNESDIEELKKQVEKYGLENVLAFEEEECKIMAYIGLLESFIDDVVE
ncbi:MAG: hypothetical protein J6T10_24680 [Methanobrevibacter sp.]|nr:hypothetical protein [Methanobrevibacter sp.]